MQILSNETLIKVCRWCQAEKRLNDIPKYPGFTLTNRISMLKSATTSRAGGMRKSPRRGRGHALLVVADLQKEFWLQFTFILILCAFTIFDKIILKLGGRSCRTCINLLSTTQPPAWLLKPKSGPGRKTTGREIFDFLRVHQYWFSNSIRI
jgi:hypothetical protein